MNIHEHQAKDILRNYGVPTSFGYHAFSVEEAVQGAKKLQASGTKVFVVKAQIHAGGRGKAGGVKVVKTIEDVEKEATRMLGMTLVTHQTGEEGRVVKRLYIENGSEIKQELYLSAILDRSSASIVFIASKEGGVDIEEVAENHPEKIIKVSILTETGLQGYHVRNVLFGIGLGTAHFKQLNAIMSGIYKILTEKDAMQIEINPLIINGNDELTCLDAKFGFDANALFRHKDIAELYDPNEEDPLEAEARESGLNYVKMSGNIGCMVNGAGLAMATMDIIELYGQKPANFLDVGGGANKEKVTKAFKIILSDQAVKGVLVNIFGGIMRCDIIAEGIIAAVKEVGITIPLVVRLEGTNVDLGKKILSESGLNITSADDLDDAAAKIVKCIK
jgi:succinyl-CoA synthetase beta subunit